MATKGSKKGGSKGSAKKSSKAGASKSSGAGSKKPSAGAKRGAKKGAAKKGGGKKGVNKRGGGKGKRLLSPKVKKIAGSILGAAAAGAFKGVVEEVVPKVEKAAGVTDKDKADK